MEQYRKNADMQDLAHATAHLIHGSSRRPLHDHLRPGPSRARPKSRASTSATPTSTRRIARYQPDELQAKAGTRRPTASGSSSSPRRPPACGRPKKNSTTAVRVLMLALNNFVMHDIFNSLLLHRSFRPRSLSLLGCVLLALTGSCSQALEPRSSTPATTAEAAKVIDLSALPLMRGAVDPRRQDLAGLSYDAPGTVKNVFEFQRKQLIDLKWQELPNSYVSDQSSNATFSLEGFTLSLSVNPASEPDLVSVTLLSHGNVDLGQLPLPAGATESYVGPAVAMFVTETPVVATAQAIRKLLLEKGWQPYGTAGDSQFFKQNAIQLTATVSAAGRKGGKTIISSSSLLMSVDCRRLPTRSACSIADATA